MLAATKGSDEKIQVIIIRIIVTAAVCDLGAYRDVANGIVSAYEEGVSADIQVIHAVFLNLTCLEFNIAPHIETCDIHVPPETEVPEIHLYRSVVSKVLIINIGDICAHVDVANRHFEGQRIGIGIIILSGAELVKFEIVKRDLSVTEPCPEDGAVITEF